MTVFSKVLGATSGLIILALLVGAVWFFFIQTPYRRFLPKNASEVMEETIMDPSAVSTTFLKAKIGSEDFQKYCQDLKLSPLNDPNVFKGEAYQYANWKAERKPGWWSPSESLTGTWYATEKRSVVLAKMERGILYLKAVYY
ncbi:MAG: hypothetical protein N3A38_00790 [Planctomycetota bacterium]|nr:hypothetical protein [Planctomycetota bacterium]